MLASPPTRKDRIPPPEPAWPPARVSRLGLLGAIAAAIVIVLLFAVLLALLTPVHSFSIP